MPDRAILREHFAGMLEAAQTAASKYGRLAKTAEDPAMKGELLRLAGDEQRHVELAERLLDIVDE